MFGTFRLLLACGVIVAHMGVTAGGVHFGVAAVVGFFMVSGYTMTGLIQASFPDPRRDALRFYRDRFVRLAPQYYFYLALCALTVLAFGWREGPMQAADPGAIGWFASLAVVPLDFYMFNDSIRTSMLNVPAWSLGLEVLFYLLLPWLLPGRWRLWAAVAAGVVVWTLATQGVIDGDVYGYRLMPGALLFFIVGVAMQRREWVLFGTLAGFFMLSAVALAQQGKLDLAFNRSLLTGAAVGFAGMLVLSRLPRRGWDDRLGSVSYGTYLAHWILLTLFNQHFGQAGPVAMVVVGSIVAGWASYLWVERPTLALRRRIRSRRYPTPSSSTSNTSVALGGMTPPAPRAP